MPESGHSGCLAFYGKGIMVAQKYLWVSKARTDRSSSNGEAPVKLLSLHQQ